MEIKEEPGPPRQLTMNSGDVLHIPPGQRRICRSEGYSVHLAIMMQAATGIALRNRPEKALQGSKMLQEPVSAILVLENDRKMAEEFHSHLHELVDQLNIAEIFALKRKHLRIRPKVRLSPRQP